MKFFSEKQHQQIHFYLLVLFCFCLLPLPRISVFTIIAMVLNWLSGAYPWKKAAVIFRGWPLLFLSFYLLHLIGIFYTQNQQEGLADIETKLSLLFFPIVLFAIPLSRPNARAIVLRSFVAGCLVGTLYAYGRAGLLYLDTGLNAFFYTYLSDYIHTHPTYLAIYLCFALFLLLEEMLRKFGDLSLEAKLFRLVLMGHFLLFIFLLTARMQLLVLVFLLALSFVWYMNRRKKLVKGLALLLVALLALAALVSTLPHTRQRTQEAWQQFHDPQTEGNIRGAIWKAAAQKILEKPLFGYGTGDVQDVLEEAYRQDKVTEALEEHYNAHNQYLQTSIALGLVGSLLLLVTLFFPLLRSLQQQKYTYAFFLGLIILSMLTESFLETQKGILFYAFFNSFFALGLYPHQQT